MWKHLLQLKLKRIIITALIVAIYPHVLLANKQQSNQYGFAIASESVVFELQKHLVWADYDNWATGLNWPSLRAFYAKRDFLPIWHDLNGPTTRAEIVLDALVNAFEEGLEPDEYHVPSIRYMWHSKRAITRARLELLLTDALLRYGLEVSVGYQYPKAVDFDWYIKPQKINPLKLLESAIATADIDSFLKALPPR